MKLKLSIMPGAFAVCRLGPQAQVPEWAVLSSPLVSVSRTLDELSIICPEERVPDEVQREGGWRCLKILGPLPFFVTGVLASIVVPLAEAKVSVFAFSTFDRDYVLVKEETLALVRRILSARGHAFE